VLEILKPTHLQRFTLLLFLFGGLSGVRGQSGTNSTEPPAFTAPSVVVAEAVTGTVLLEKTPDMVFPTASLAKLMTLNLSLEDVEAGTLESARIYPVPVEGTARRTGPGSSVLGLKDGDRASLITLQRAAAVASSNDAARALAILSSGSLSAFVDRMNLTARNLGMNETHYIDPDGWSAKSRTSAADQMNLARHYLLSHSGAPPEIHGKTALEYEDGDRLSSYPRKSNTNLLVGRVAGVDGLKTGAISPSYFHLIATAQRNGVRFIAVVMGIEADSYSEGLKARAEDTEKLLEWSFENYTLMDLDSDISIDVRVRHGEKEHVTVRPENIPVPVVIKRGRGSGAVILIDAPEYLKAPVKAGTAAGTVQWFMEGRPVHKELLIVGVDVGYRWKIKDLFFRSRLTIP
jgi:D-alanyl-D-alanine carboxypeptidase (penicillin-binding protein 5/6)